METRVTRETWKKKGGFCFSISLVKFEKTKNEKRFRNKNSSLYDNNRNSGGQSYYLRVYFHVLFPLMD